MDTHFWSSDRLCKFHWRQVPLHSSSRTFPVQVTSVITSECLSLLIRTHVCVCKTQEGSHSDGDGNFYEAFHIESLLAALVRIKQRSPVYHTVLFIHWNLFESRKTWMPKHPASFVWSNRNMMAVGTWAVGNWNQARGNHHSVSEAASRNTAPMQQRGKAIWIILCDLSNSHQSHFTSKWKSRKLASMQHFLQVQKRQD